MFGKLISSTRTVFFLILSHCLGVTLSQSLKVYVYDLPSKFNSELFEFVDCGWHVRGYDHHYNGMGSPVGDQNSIRKNDQYTYEAVIHQRMLSYENRVYKKEEADLFYIPYYVAYAFHAYLIEGSPKAMQEMGLKRLSNQLIEHLVQVEGVKPDEWSKHFIAMGREEGMFFGGRFYLFEVTSPFLQMIRIHYRQDCRSSYDEPWRFNQTCPDAHNLNVVVAPQVSSVHATYGEPFPWTQENNRSHLVTFVGNDRQNRHFIVEQLASETCGTECLLEIGDNPKIPDGPRIEQVVNAYTSSEFCLQPWGDGPLRRGIYDSITLGCIPVFFVNARKPWDTFIDYDLFSITLQPDQHYDIVKTLRGISDMTKKQLHMNLKTYAQFFQWSFGKPPLVDAFDVMMSEVQYVNEKRHIGEVSEYLCAQCEGMVDDNALRVLDENREFVGVDKKPPDATCDGDAKKYHGSLNLLQASAPLLDASQSSSSKGMCECRTSKQGTDPCPGNPASRHGPSDTCHYNQYGTCVERYISCPCGGPNNWTCPPSQTCFSGDLTSNLGFCSRPSNRGFG